MSGASTQSHLRVVGGDFALPAKPAAHPPSPVLQASDPRWVLAVRTQEQLQGPILRPDRREKLIRLGRMLGLGVFESNLVIAIVQDQARRGLTLADVEPTLRMVPLQSPRRPRRINQLIIGCTVSGLIAMEILLVCLLV